MSTPEVHGLKQIMEKEYQSGFEQLYAAQQWYRNLATTQQKALGEVVRASLLGHNTLFDDEDAVLLSGYLNIPGTAENLVQRLRAVGEAGQTLLLAIHETRLDGPLLEETCGALEHIVSSGAKGVSRNLALQELSYRRFTRAVPYIQAVLDEGEKQSVPMLSTILAARLDQVGYEGLRADVACVVAGIEGRRVSVRRALVSGLPGADKFDAKKFSELMAAV